MSAMDRQRTRRVGMRSRPYRCPAVAAPAARPRRMRRIAALVFDLAPGMAAVIVGLSVIAVGVVGVTH